MTDEMGALVQQLTAGAEQRGIRVVPAQFAKESVHLIYDATSVDDVLDIIQQSFTPFISILASTIDRDDVEKKFLDDEDDELPSEVARILDDHEDDVSEVDVYWVASGVVFRYSAMPAWREELSDLLAEQRADQEAHHFDDLRSHWIRVTALADQLEMEPGYRAASLQERPAVAKNLFEQLRGPEDDFMMEKHVVEEAGKRVRANATAAYASVDITSQELVERLQRTPEWINASGAVERDAATTQFLIQLTGGYAPKRELVVALRRRAALPPRRPSTR